jgi:hypothetical protein
MNTQTGGTSKASGKAKDKAKDKDKDKTKDKANVKGHTGGEKKTGEEGDTKRSVTKHCTNRPLL